MRWINKQAQEDEKGAAAVLVALLLVVLLACAAIVVDVGRLYVERAELQNGADAVALELAYVCATDTTPKLCSEPDLSEPLAGLNAHDGYSSVAFIDRRPGQITVTTSAREPNGPPNHISLTAAQVLGFDSAKVTATSSAAWGAPSKAVVLPLAIAECKFNLDPLHKKGAVQLLNFDSGGCGEIPGGFSWIGSSTTSAECSIKLTAGAADDSGVWFDSKTGASIPSSCSGTDLHSIQDKTVLLPLFDEATGNGSSGKYFIKGFASFHITGYKFPSQTWWSDSDGLRCNNKCIKGYFVEHISLNEALEIGGEQEYGTFDVRLVK